MLQEFYKSGLANDFIKEYLSNTPCPLYDVVRKGDTIVEGYIYLYDFHIIRAKITGILMNPLSIIPANEQFEIIGHWKHHQYIPNITKMYRFPESYYGKDLHKNLGTLLRTYRGFYDINLMNMYNCYSGETFDDIWLSDTRNDKGSFYNISVNDQYKVYAVPIKFNRIYNIYIDSTQDVTIYPVLKNRYKYFDEKEDQILSKCIYATLLDKRDDSSKSLSNKTWKQLDTAVNGLVKLPGSKFSSPTYYGVFTITDESKEAFKYEDYLYLLIQVNKSNKSSLVVLEKDFNLMEFEGVLYGGGHSEWSKGFINAEFEETQDCADLPVQTIEHFQRSKIALTAINDGVSYAYSDEIIPYLLHNVVTNREELYRNIERVQEYLPGNTHLKGFWDNRLRVEAYNKFFSPHNKDLIKTATGVNGFIDDSIETFLINNKEIIV